MQTAAPASLLVKPERHPLLPPETVASFGTTVVIAPHPDDESLGCGGLLALLAEAGQPAHVMVMTDGSRSHHSAAYPPVRLAALRERELLDAAATLGLPPGSARFLRYEDCGLPGEGSGAFIQAAARLHVLLVELAPDTLLVPWRRDPHCDHVATWTLLRAAFLDLEKRPRWLEYPVWAWTKTESDIAPQADEARAWRLDISPMLNRKKEAIARHRSQLGKIIHDDPDGFALQPEMLAWFAQPWELFIEPTDG